MKTIGMLIAVLVLTATAPASLQLTAYDLSIANGSYLQFVAGTTVTFAIVNETAATGVFDGGAFINQGTAVMGNAQLVAANLPGSWSIIDVSADLGTQALYYSWDSPAITPFGAGKLVTVDLTIGLGDIGQLTFANVNLEPIFSIRYAETPEPATLALLGLGALIIHRKQSA